VGAAAELGSRSTQKLKLQSPHSLQKQKHDDEFELWFPQEIRFLKKTQKLQRLQPCTNREHFRRCTHLLQLLRVSSFKCTITRSMIWVTPSRTPISATRCVAEDKTKKTYRWLVAFCFPLSPRKTPNRN
jgi:hypothetical protein